MSKHTPGPWYYATDIGQVGSVETGSGVVIAQAQQIHRGPADHPTREANARLIAAAPCLLKELQHLVKLLGYMEAGGGLDVPGLATLNGARAAIAKATGEDRE